MTPSQTEGPDFICVGMPKAGTGWLYDQLKYHPDFWMPPVKEFAYLLRKVPQLKSTEKQFRKLADPNRHRVLANLSNRRSCDDRDAAFVREANDSIGVPRDLERYVSFFRFKEGALTGDISTGYCELDPDIIEEVRRRLPKTKILLMVREPVDRAWSHVCMWHRKGKFDSALLDEPQAFRRFMESSGSFMRTSFPSKVARAWKEAAPTLSFRSFLFDDIRDRPTETRAEILEYLGADPKKASGELPPAHNKKARSPKLEMPDGIRQVLTRMFAEEVKDCAETFGGLARNWLLTVPVNS